MRVLMVLMLAAGLGLAQKETAPAPQLPPGLYAVIHTSMGTITAELYDKAAPVTVRSFVALARGARQWLDPKTHQPVTRPLYDNLIFHRVIPGFMIQTGDPTGTGAYSCGFTLQDEIGSLRFDRPGVLAMANKGPNTGDCQFFITEAPTPWLNGKHTIFGQVVDGQKVVSKIANVIRDDSDRPRFPIKLINIEVKRIVDTTAASRPPSVIGPGVFINSGGDVLTMYSIVQGCAQLQLKDGGKLQLAYSDTTNDLAVLHSDKKPAAFETVGEGPVHVGKVEVRSAVVMGFLEANNVPYQTAPAGGTMEPIEVQCWK